LDLGLESGMMVAVLGQMGLRPERKSDHSVLRETNGISMQRRVGVLSAIVGFCCVQACGVEGKQWFMCCERLGLVMR
jgi:hypothetical protein